MPCTCTKDPCLVDTAVNDAIKAQLTGIILTKLGHSSAPFLNVDELRHLESKLEEKVSRTQNRTQNEAQGDKNFLWVYLTPEEWINWYDRFFQAVIGVATLGAGFTFSVIVSSLEPPGGPGNSDAEKEKAQKRVDRVRLFLSLSWLLFVLSLVWASLAAQIIIVNKRWFMKSFNESNWDATYKGANSFPRLFCRTTTVIGQLLPVAAFGTSAEAVRAYQHRIGFAAEVMLGIIAFVLVIFWAGQNSLTVRRIFKINEG